MTNFEICQLLATPGLFEYFGQNWVNLVQGTVGILTPSTSNLKFSINFLLGEKIIQQLLPRLRVSLFLQNQSIRCF